MRAGVKVTIGQGVQELREKGREGRSVFSVQYVLVWKWPYVTQSIYSEYT